MGTPCNNSQSDKPIETLQLRPFLRWAGGKTRSMTFLTSHLPMALSGVNRYFEPFLGGGSLFFAVKPSYALLSDRNKDLIDCYRAVKTEPETIFDYLHRHSKLHSKKYYYKMREKYNNSEPSTSKAALFIYLNKACFNGIWRVNKDGEFNVPFGYKDTLLLPSRDELIQISSCLSAAKLIHADYHVVADRAHSGDLIYFDPPYPPLNGTSYFTHYTKERFGKEDHANLAKLAIRLSKQGVYILISNSDTRYIRSLFKDNFNIFELEVMRWVRTDGDRYKVKEIAITNFNVD